MAALSNGFAILDAVVNAGGNGLSFARIVGATGLPKASVHRLLRELQQIGALSYDEHTRHYSGGIRLARLGANLLADYDLRRTVHPHLKALHDSTGHVATLGIRNDDVGIYIDKIEARDFSLRLHSEVGKAFPLHCTGMGKVLLSAADVETRRRLCKRKLESHTDFTITDGRELRDELAEIRAQGYAVDREEITRGMMCVAAPVQDARGEVVGAMSCTFPKYVFDDHGIDREIAAVRKYARAASGLS